VNVDANVKEKAPADPEVNRDGNGDVSVGTVNSAAESGR
jgi:hypothetical protein